MSEAAPDVMFQSHLAAGRLMLQRSRESGRFIFYPRVAEPHTGCTDLEWVEVSGLGTIYSVTVVRRRDPSEDYNVVLVDLDEGVRMMSRVEGVEASNVHIGMRVRARIAAQDDAHIVVFDAADS